MSIHDELIAQGFKHIHHEEEWEDNGDGETGPMIRYDPAWDEYLTDQERVVVAEGKIQLREPRDLAFEAWCDEQQAAQS